jgi:signal transduction histidine kinase
MGYEGLEEGPELEKLGRRIFKQAVPLTFLGNCIIAGFLTALTGDRLVHNLVYSHTIGFSILLLHLVGHRLIRGTRCPHWVVTVAAVPLGSAAGLLSSWWILTGTIRGHLHSLPFAATSTLVIGGAATYYFYARARLAIADAQHKAHELKAEESARQLAEAELKLLQAQIEPHFLFNTLSNVVSLIDGDPPRAKKMLLNLTSYLRGSLRRTRAGAVTLGEELQLVRAYLEIQAVRMGPRLGFRIDCADDVREAPLPPLLLQPLVENALKHGLEPRPQGGTVTVSAARLGEELVLEVRDDGLGLDPHHRAGVGLTNVRRRVEAVSGGRGSLTLRPLAEGGLCARICLPIPSPAGPPLDAAAAPERPAPLAPKVSP